MNVSPVKSFTYRVSFFGLTILASTAVIAMAAILKPSLAAQAAHTLTYDQPATGTISDTNPEDRWTFTAPGQDAISITVARDEKDQPAGVINTIIPEVTLQDATGKVIAQAAHDPQTYDNAVIQSNILPAAGTYTVAIDRYQGQAGKTQGVYSILIHLIGAAPDQVNYLSRLLTTTPTPVPTRPSAAQVLPGINPVQDDFNALLIPDPNGRPIIGSIYNDQWARVYLLSPDLARNSNHNSEYIIPAPFQISAHVFRLNGDLLPTLSLVPLDLVQGEGAGATLNPTVTTTLKNFPTPIAYATPEPISTNTTTIPYTNFTTNLSTSLSAAVMQSGEYALVISREGGQQGITTGQFIVQIDSFVVPYTFNNQFMNDGYGIAIGDAKTGNIAKSYVVTYRLDVTAPQAISISVQRTSGSLLPIVWVEDSNSNKLASADTDTETFSTATITKMQLPAAGRYRIVVAGQGEQLGVTSGDFTIKVSAVTP